MYCNFPLSLIFGGGGSKYSELGKNLKQILVYSGNWGHKKSFMTWLSYGRGAEQAEFQEINMDGKASMWSFVKEDLLCN